MVCLDRSIMLNPSNAATRTKLLECALSGSREVLWKSDNCIIDPYCMTS